MDIENKKAEARLFNIANWEQMNLVSLQVDALLVSFH